LGRFLRFAVILLATTGLLAVIGWLPTLRLGGEPAIRAMGVALGICLLASLLGALPLALVGDAAEPHQRATAILAALGIRLFVALLLAVAAVYSGWFATKALLIWLVIGYLALMVIDTMHALQAQRAGALGTSKGNDR
jgi:hypothetical protein